MEWEEIPSWPKYKINRKGEIIGQRHKRLKTHVDKQWGYKTVALSDDGYQKTVKVHRLVAETFIPNPEGKPTVNHKNGIKTDNRVENLEWATVQEQQIHRVHKLGIGTDKAVEALKKPIKCVETGEIFGSIKEAAKSRKGDRGRLSKSAHSGQSWHGLHWVLIKEREAKWH